MIDWILFAVVVILLIIIYLLLRKIERCRRGGLSYKSIFKNSSFQTMNVYPDISGEWKSDDNSVKYVFDKFGPKEYKLTVNKVQRGIGYYIAPETLFVPVSVGQLNGNVLTWGRMENDKFIPEGDVWNYKGGLTISSENIGGQWDKAFVYAPKFDTVVYSQTDKGFDLIYDKGYIVRGKFLVIDEDYGKMYVYSITGGQAVEYDIVLSSKTVKSDIQKIIDGVVQPVPQDAPKEAPKPAQDVVQPVLKASRQEIAFHELERLQKHD